MVLEMCVETYGAAVHIFDAIVGSGILLRGNSAEKRVSAEPGAVFAETVRSATDELTFAEAQALWLVDVCAYRYDEAAGIVGVDREVFAGRVRDARHGLRYHTLS